MHDYLLNHVPTSARPWVRALIEQADQTSLTRFVQWHSTESLAVVFAREPHWPPPSWGNFIHSCIPDWPPIIQGITGYLALKEFKRLRDLAWDIAGQSTTPVEAGYRVFCWVSEHVSWTASWGSATPLEIIDRGYGSSYHIAQVVAALCRTLFIPARLVEEIAFIPDRWRREAHQVWRKSPRQVLHWMGEKTFFHPFCEILTGRCWEPVDVQRAQFGRFEVQQHLRTPQLLKLVVRTWEDYGRRIDRTNFYTITPLTGRRQNQAAQDFRENLRLLEKSLPDDLESAHQTLVKKADLLKHINELAGRLWEEQGQKRSYHLLASESAMNALKYHIRAVVPGAVTLHSSASSMKGNSLKHLILAGVTDMEIGECLEHIRTGSHALVLYESWGKGEHLIDSLLSGMGGALGSWLSPPANGRAIHEVVGTGRLSFLLSKPCLDLTLIKSLLPPPASDGSLLVTFGTKKPSCTIAVTIPFGRGRLTIAPTALAIYADPYAVSSLAGFHRRILGMLGRL